MTRNNKARRLFSAVLVGSVLIAWVLIGKYTTPASPATPASLGSHWLAMATYLGALFGTVILGLVVAFWNRSQRIGLLIRAWNLVVAVGLIVLYFITSDPVAQAGLEQIGLGALRWVFLASGILSLAASFLLFGSFVDVQRAGSQQKTT